MQQRVSLTSRSELFRELSNFDIAFKNQGNDSSIPDHLRNAHDYCDFLLDLPTRNFRPDLLLLNRYLQSSKPHSRIEFSFVREEEVYSTVRSLKSRACEYDMISLNLIC